jgi:sirohydrochlorin ferrochelatase
MAATCLLAAHGTRSPAGTATSRALLAAVAAARPHVAVRLCFLDVAAPSLAEALDDLDGTDVVVVPLLLSAGYHVTADIPAVVHGHDRARVARHLGPDPAVVEALVRRLAEAGGTGASGTTALAAIASSRASANDEVATAADGLSRRLGRPVRVLPLDGAVGPALAALPQPVEVAVYLLAEGGFLDVLHAGGAAVVAAPIGVHPAVVDLVWSRYDEVAGA